MQTHGWKVQVIVGLGTLILLLIAAFWLTTMPSAARPAPVAATASHSDAQALVVHPDVQPNLHTGPSRQVDPTPTATPYPPSDNCVKCHTDKAKLQELAEEPEKVKSEMASGEG